MSCFLNGLAMALSNEAEWHKVVDLNLLSLKPWNVSVLQCCTYSSSYTKYKSSRNLIFQSFLLFSTIFIRPSHSEHKWLENIAWKKIIELLEISFYFNVIILQPIGIRLSFLCIHFERIKFSFSLATSPLYL